jgi:hypothetical protein
MTDNLMAIILAASCILISFPVAAQDCSQSLSTETREAITEAWTEEALRFIDGVWQTARRKDLSDQDRQQQYEKHMQKLVAKARELRIATEPLQALARECLEHEENSRSPSPGWDPADRGGNLMLFSQTSSRIVQIHLQLMSYARKYCQ